MKLSKQFNEYLGKLEGRLLKGGYLLENEMKDTVAIDTGKLRDDINTSKVSRNGTQLKVSVGTDDIDYAKYVEYGSKDMIMNYHRRSGGSRPVVWVGVGMQYMERSLDKVKQKIINLLKG